MKKNFVMLFLSSTFFLSFLCAFFTGDFTCFFLALEVNSNMHRGCKEGNRCCLTKRIKITGRRSKDQRKHRRFQCILNNKSEDRKTLLKRWRNLFERCKKQRRKTKWQSNKAKMEQNVPTKRRFDSITSSDWAHFLLNNKSGEVEQLSSIGRDSKGAMLSLSKTIRQLHTIGLHTHMPWRCTATVQQITTINLPAISQKPIHLVK